MRLMMTREFCGYQVVSVNAKHGVDEFHQTDWDFPALARQFGWNGKIKRGDKCAHRGTDGTVTCPDCGATAGQFISAAAEFLDANDGKVILG